MALVIPFYNEEFRIGGGQYLLELSNRVNADFYYVNDGSKDKTQERLFNLSRTTKAKVIDLAVNSGKGEAIRSGLIEATQDGQYEIIGYLDADGAFPVSEVARSLDLAKSIFFDKPEIDIFIASRVKLAGKKIHRSTVRHFFSRLIITSIGFYTRNMPYDSQSGLKFFRNLPELKAIIDSPFSTRWFFDLELMTRLGMQRKNCTWEEPVDFWCDVKGSKIGVLSVFSIAREMIRVIRVISRS